MESFEEKVKMVIAQQISQLCLSVELNPKELVDQIKKAILKEYDYQFNIRCLHRYQAIKRGKEHVLGESWKEQWLFDDQDLIVSIGHDNGFLYFDVNRQKLIEIVITSVIDHYDLETETNSYGHNQDGIGPEGVRKKILVEYSSPNIAKPFHMGHLRSTIIGNFIKNIYQMANYQTIGINYLGDWGKQYGLLAVAWERYGGKEKELSLELLYDLYVKINTDLKKEQKTLGIQRTPLDLEAHEYFKKMENGDSEALALWRRLRSFSLLTYNQSYQRLGIKFDVCSGESYQGDDDILDVLTTLENEKLIQKDEKGSFIDLTADQLGHAIVTKSNDSSLYLTRDLSEVNRRFERWEFDQCIYVVGKTQKHHFQQFFRLLELMKSPAAGKCKHIGFGNIIGLSTRLGTAVFLSDVLDTAKEKMKNVMKENQAKLKEIVNPDWTADQLGISAVVVQDLSAKRNGDYKFDWDRITSFKGETGPYLQYAYARLCSIFRKVDGLVKLTSKIDLSLLVEDEAFALIKLIGQYPMIIKKCQHNLEPVVLIEYLFDLSKAISVAHQVLQIKKIAETGLFQVAEARLLLFWTAKITLGSGLRTIGLTPITAM